MQEIMLGTVRKTKTHPSQMLASRSLQGLMGMTWLEITLKQNKNSKELKEQ